MFLRFLGIDVHADASRDLPGFRHVTRVQGGIDRVLRLIGVGVCALWCGSAASKATKVDVGRTPLR